MLLTFGEIWSGHTAVGEIVHPIDFSSILGHNVDENKEGLDDTHEGTNDPTPFICYMLQVILACYVEFEERVGLMNDAGVKSTAYDVVRAYAEQKVGKFTSADVIISCPSAGRSALLKALRELVEEGRVIRLGSGRSTCYVRVDKDRIESSNE